jgi:hypothetical protein
MNRQHHPPEEITPLILRRSVSRVLIIDNELHPETLVNRLDRSANGMMIDFTERKEAIDVIPPRELGLDVLEAVTRSFNSPEPVSIRFEYPLWSAIACPAVLKTRKPAGGKSQADQVEKGKRARYLIRKAFQGALSSIVLPTGSGDS